MIHEPLPPKPGVIADDYQIRYLLLLSGDALKSIRITKITEATHHPATHFPAILHAYA